VSAVAVQIISVKLSRASASDCEQENPTAVYKFLIVSYVFTAGDWSRVR